MRALTRRLRARAGWAGRSAPDPAPAPWRYRLSRLWRRRWVRRAVLAQAPALALGAFAVGLAADPATHAALAERAAELRAALDSQPQFKVREIEVEGASDELAPVVRDALGDAMGASSLALDPAALRARVEALPRVAAARIALEAPGLLRVGVTERRPAALWRVAGRLRVIDAEGHDLGPVARRADRPDLPLLLGPGADRAAAEGLALIAQAAPLAPRLRGLVRVGDRRWDMALDRDVTIRLPAVAPRDALAAALALQAEAQVLDRDIRALDLRLADRPTLRLGPAAAEALELRRAAARPGEDA
ncbi:MAG: cell division protein FtsQ/DivIB [Rubrimonas sp.]|uniref:cell division protein FtsQ/DivIB n=1 Tax=Rubrimonas sp. TaxID=2036015 RepID=UPI002FDD6BAB